jgi:hypothetical protein
MGDKLGIENTITRANYQIVEKNYFVKTEMLGVVI